jgi:hypothetical protein
MLDRIHWALDGELPADGLTPQELDELRQYRATIGTSLEPIRYLPPIDVTSAVMRQVASGPGPVARALAALWRWLWSPRPLTVRPAFALAGALALAVVGSTVLLHSASPGPGPARVIVQFRLGDDQAREVALVGDFNAWRPEHRMHRSADGVWSVDVALEPGVYDYVFVIDGTTTRLDPLAPRVTDGFGGASSRVAVLPPAMRS